MEIFEEREEEEEENTVFWQEEHALEKQSEEVKEKGIEVFHGRGFYEKDLFQQINLVHIFFYQFLESHIIDHNPLEIQGLSADYTELLMNYPEYSYKFELIQPYFLPTRLVYFYSSLYHHLQNSESLRPPRFLPKVRKKCISDINF